MAMEKNKLIRIIAIGAVAFVLIIALVLGIVFGAKSCRKSGPGDITIPIPDNGGYNPGGNVKPGDEYLDRTPGEENFDNPSVPYNYNTQLKTTTEVGFASKQIGTVERNVPKRTRDEGLGAYPKYGYTLSTVIGMDADKVALRNALIEESDYLCAYGTHNNSGNGNNGDGTYTWMDVNGYLYSGTRAEPVQAIDPSGNHRRLYKHSASVGLYMGDVAENEPGIIKTVTMRRRGYSGYGVTGVYAPAGEVIKITISEEDMKATGGLTIHIGQALFNGQSNNIWTAKNQMQRFPNILNTMTLNANTCKYDEETHTYIGYVGSFVGGPLYIRNTNTTFTATISGGVAYSHFILGYTTKEEFEQNSKSSAPYFDLEVWDYGVLHSGPKLYAQSYSYEDLYKAAVLWDKVSSVTTTGSSQGIVFLYDPFVAAGAAVAFPGRRSVNCPTGWMGSSLNYNGIVTSGSWGNFHEYHHNFQSYGVGNGGEVTNNGMTLVSYALFTKISSKRGLMGYGSQGLGGWNSYTSATWALSELLKLQSGGTPSNGAQGLTIYATLLHNFGPDNYIQAKVNQQSNKYGESYAGYMRAWENITHNDMTYFFKDVLKGLDDATATKFHNTEYTSKFVPVSSVYQTGRSYMYDGEKKYITTMQPFVIPYDEDYTVDLRPYTANDGQYSSGSIVLPEGFSYKIKSITQPSSGTLTETSVKNVYTYKPGNNVLSGKIQVTLQITKDDNAFEVDDVDLTLEFEQSHETNKMTLERTTYTYAADKMYTDAVAAYDAGFAGYTSVNEKWAHSNPTQNCNTDIWYYNDSNASSFPNADPEKHKIKDNVIEVIDGKLYFEEAGKYRIYLRGRKNCAVYYSLDGSNYQLGAKVTNGSGANFYLNNSETYFDLELGEHSWVYTREVLIVQSSASSYIGLGYGAWTKPMFTMVEKYYDSKGNEVASPEAENYHHSQTHYYNYQGVEVTEQEANNAELIAPTRASYINAYRRNYEFPDNNGFETEYFYKRQYKYTYSEAYDKLNQSYVTDPKCPSNFPKENLFDNDLKTACSSPAIVTSDAPWDFTVDLGEVITANRFVLTGRLNNNASNQNQTPNSITLYAGLTPETMEEVTSFDNGTVSGITLQFNFDERSFRYYRLVVRKTVQGRYAAIANIEFSYTIGGGEKYSPDGEAFKFEGKWGGIQGHSSFGHVYLGTDRSTLKFEFEGTRLGILSSSALPHNFEVEIDGVKVTSIVDPAKQSGDTVATFISDLLKGGKHTVVLKCVGEANVDSIVIYP